jgi:lysophospholipase L1-like esterase
MPHDLIDLDVPLGDRLGDRIEFLPFAAAAMAGDRTARPNDGIDAAPAAGLAAEAAVAASFAGQGGAARTVDLARGFWAEAPRVLPLGDSNTLGLSNMLPPARLEGYRAALWSRLAADGLAIDYVGSRANGPASLPDLDHQGVSGIRATTVVGQARSLAATHRPDVVLLMLGTNDALNEANAAATVPGELLAIMRGIDAVRPDAAILVAPLPPIDPDAPGFVKRDDADAIRGRLNAKLPGLAADAREAGIDARFVAMPALGKGDLYDGVHLTKAGHAKIAAAWHRALDDGLARGAFGAQGATEGVRDVEGSERGDMLRGDAGANRLIGRGGADRIEGMGGADALNGGAGADVFVYARPAHGGDRIAGFAAVDVIEIDAAGFGGGLDPGDQPILRSGATPRAKGSAGQFLYDRDDGRLSWDRDGAGPAKAAPIATLTGAPALGADDFLIV